MKRISFGFFTMAAALTFLGDSCSGSLVSDGSFQSWRSDTELGAWQVTVGHIQKVATWSDADPGAELVDDPTNLTQRITPGPGDTCARVEIMAKVEGSARLTIRAGGTPLQVPELDWEKHVDYMQLAARRSVADAGGLDFTTPAYDPIALVLSKSGKGRVVLVKLTVVGTSSCRPDTSGDVR